MLDTLAALLCPSVAIPSESPATLIASRPQKQGPEAELVEAIESYVSAKSRLREALQACKSDDQRLKLLQASDWTPFIETFRRIARDSGNSQTSAEAWIWVVRLCKSRSPDQARTGVEALLENHMSSERLEALVEELVHPGGLGQFSADRALERLAAKSPVKSVRNAAKLTLADRKLGRGNQPKAARDSARRMYTELREAYEGDAKTLRRINRSLYELDHLQIGMPAPEFEAVDADGVPFKLSDYRGKVVVLDFWGFW